MSATTHSSNKLSLDESTLKTVRSRLELGAITPAYRAHRETIVKLLNNASATELACVRRYKRHHFMASGLSSPYIAEEFMAHANEESAHADRIAKRIVQLDDEPDFSPSTLLHRNHADNDESNDLKTMVRVNLVAERIAVKAHRPVSPLLADKDPTTRKIPEDIRAEEEEHADELKDWLDI